MCENAYGLEWYPLNATKLAPSEKDSSIGKISKVCMWGGGGGTLLSLIVPKCPLEIESKTYADTIIWVWSSCFYTLV